MYVETLIKTRLNADVEWCPELKSTYIRELESNFRSDGRLINVVHQLSEDSLQYTQTYLFRTKADFDAFRNDPIVSAVFTLYVGEYDRKNGISTRVVVDHVE